MAEHIPEQERIAIDTASRLFTNVINRNIALAADNTRLLSDLEAARAERDTFRRLREDAILAHNRTYAELHARLTAVSDETERQQAELDRLRKANECLQLYFDDADAERNRLRKALEDILSTAEPLSDDSGCNAICTLARRALNPQPTPDGGAI